MKVVVCDLQVKFNLFSSEQEIAFLQGMRMLMSLMYEQELPNQASVVPVPLEQLVCFIPSVAQMECEK